MSVSTEVRITRDQLTPTIREVLKAIGPQNRIGLNKVAGRAALNAAKVYHRDFDDRGGWSRGGRAKGTDFGEQVVRAWGLAQVTSERAVLTNDAPHFAFKIIGGIIRPKRVKALTIPLITEARGRFAETFERATGHKLFIPKGTNVLAYKTGKKSFKAVYALVQSVTHKPTKGAMPPDSVFIDPFVRSITDQLRDALN